MNRRILLVGLAVVLALLGTLAVYGYAKSADQRAIADTRAATVLYAHQGIAAGTTWQEAVKNGSLQVERVPASSTPQTALSSLHAPVGADEVATADIPAGQIVVRENFGREEAKTGALTIPKGKIAITASLGMDQDVAGFPDVGSQVVVFLTYNVILPDGSPLKKQLNGNDPTVTRVLLPRTSVLAVTNSPTTTLRGAAATANQSTGGSVMVTLGVTQSEAEKLILGQKTGQLWLGLLSDSSQTSLDPGTANVQGVPKAAPMFLD